MTSVDGHWHLGIGDPTPMGWFTVAAYCAAAWVCWQAHTTQRARALAAARPCLWLLMTIALGLLGINKQLDLQTALTDLGRAFAHRDGWYEQRHAVQAYFIIVVGAAGALGLLGLGWLSRPLSIGRSTAIVGFVFLSMFVLVRASSFHQVDLLLRQPVLGWTSNWILELSGIGLVSLGAIVERRAARKWATPACQL